MKADDRRRVADNGQTHSPQTLVEQPQQTHNQEQHVYLQYPTVDPSHASMAQYQQAMEANSAYQQQGTYSTDDVEEVEENYTGEYDAQHQQLQNASDGAGDSDENENGKRKAPVDGELHEERVDTEGNPGEGERAKKKRRRQALSCTECKRRKIRCDRNHPCSPCARRGDQDKCRWTLLDPIVIGDDTDPNHPAATTIHTTPFPPSTRAEGYVTRVEFEELKQHLFRIESVLSGLFPPGTFSNPINPLQPNSSPYLNLINQYSVIPPTDASRMAKEGLQSISHPMYLTTTYPQLPIMLNVGAPPSQVVNGASPSSVSASPGIFANYLHSVPPQFSPNPSPSAANPNAFTNNTPVVGHAPPTPTPQGVPTGATGGIAPASTTTAAGPGPSNPNKSSATGSRKRLTANGASQNVASGQSGSSTPSSKQARSEAAKLARQQQQQQSTAPGTDLTRAGRGGSGTSSRLRGIALNPNQSSPQPTLIDTTLDGSRQLAIYRPNPVPTVATSIEAGEEDDDDEMDADADADGDGDEEGMNPTGAGVGTGLPSPGNVTSAMGTRIDGLTA